MVRLLAEDTPQHILQHRSCSFAYTGTQAAAHVEQSTHLNHVVGDRGASSFDIALRMSSKLKDASLGFVFGRNPQKCDIELRAELQPFRVSNAHFRIYLTEGGILMLKDMSTNGTFVDQRLLKHGDPNPSARVIAPGSIIEIIGYDHEESIRFIVSVPSRDRGMDAYGQNLAEYVAYLQQVTRQAEAVRKARKEGKHVDVPEVRPILPSSSLS